MRKQSIKVLLAALLSATGVVNGQTRMTLDQLYSLADEQNQSIRHSKPPWKQHRLEWLPPRPRDCSTSGRRSASDTSATDCSATGKWTTGSTSTIPTS